MMGGEKKGPATESGSEPLETARDSALLQVAGPDYRKRSYLAFELALSDVFERVKSGKAEIHQLGEGALGDDAHWRIVELLGTVAPGFPAGQAIKDIQEFLKHRNRVKLLDAIVYLVFLYLETPAPTEE